MKIGIISDTHGGISGWQNAWEILKETQLIIHCGDIFNHGPGNPLPANYNPKELLNIFNNLRIPLLISKGNCDSEVDQTFLNIPLSFPFLFFQIENYRFIVSHGHLYSEEDLFQMSKKWNINFLISGHTHLWKLEKKGNIFIINPGSVSLPKNNPSFGLLDLSDKFISIYSVEDYKILKKIEF